MKTLGWLVCSAFIEKQGAGDRKNLLKFLSPTQRKEVESLPVPTPQLCLGLKTPKECLEQIHLSWFVPFLRSRSQEEISLFLSIFPEEKSSFLQKELLSSLPRLSLSACTISFLQTKLLESLLEKQQDILPEETFPPSKLQALLSLHTQEISLLVDFLGLYDLAIELRQIIDTTRIKKIYTALSKEKREFLQMIMQRPNSLAFKKMELTAWKGDTTELLHLLYKRGMNRLAKALYPEHPSFIWHICHRITTEQAHLFSSYHKKLDLPQAYTYLAEQIKDVLSFLQKHKRIGSS